MLLKRLFNFYDLRKSASFTFLKKIFWAALQCQLTGQLPNFRFTIVEKTFSKINERLRHILAWKEGRMTISLIKTSLNYTFSKVSSINRPLTWDLKALYALDNKAWRDTFVIFLLAFCCKKHTIKLMIFMHAKLPDLCRYTVFLWPFVLLCHTLHIVWKLDKMSHFPKWCS